MLYPQLMCTQTGMLAFKGCTALSLGLVGTGCMKHLAFQWDRQTSLDDKAHSMWLPDSAGGGHTSQE